MSQSQAVWMNKKRSLGELPTTQHSHHFTPMSQSVQNKVVLPVRTFSGRPKQKKVSQQLH